MYEADPDARKVIDVAKGLEGLRRQDGIHAAAVVITKDPLTEYLPIQRKPESGQAHRGRPGRHPVRDARRRGARPPQDGLPRAAQPRRHHRHARAHQATTRGVERRHRPRPPRRRAHLRAAPAGRLDRRVPAGGRRRCGRSCGRCAPPTSTTSPPSWPSTGRGRWRPTCTTTTPTGRTGASRSSTSTPTRRRCWPTPTGLMIYQESMMRVAQRFAGYSLAEADNLRKACGKKNRELIAKERVKFAEGCERHRLRRRARHRSGSTSSSRSPTTPSTRATPTATGSSPTRPPT